MGTEDIEDIKGNRGVGGAGPLAGLAAERVDVRFKGLPPDADGLTVGELAAQRRNLFTGGFTTPVLALSAERLTHNLELMETYAARHGLSFAPHGKTSMAPQLFHRQLDHGAWGITLAVPHQVRVARAFGIQRVFLVNELVDPAALRWIAAELAADPDFAFVCYVDSVRGVELMDAALAGAGTRPLDVVVELGAGEGARTGVRTEAECAAVADAVAAAATLRLVGVAGYEGEVPGADPERVRAWLRRLVALAADFDKAGRFDGADEVIVSAGGSAWFDAVADVFAEIPELSLPVLKLLRSGAYVSHDDGHYRRITPFNRVPEEGAWSPPSASGRRSSPAPPSSRPSRTRASGTRRTTSICPSPRWSAGRGLRNGPPPASRSPVSPISTPGCVRPRRRIWRSVTGWAWASPTRARRSTSGS